MTKFQRAAWAALLTLAWAGCGGGGSPAAPDAADGTGDAAAEIPPLRTPTLAQIRPAEVAAGGPGFELELDGDGFGDDAVVLVGGVPMVTRVVSPTALEADVPETSILGPGPRDVVVVHTGADGGSSASLTLDVVLGTAAPVLDALAPETALAGTAEIEVGIDGWNFLETSVVRWNGAARATRFVDSTRLFATITADDLAAPGVAAVTVETGSEVSAEALTFTIGEPPVGGIGVQARIGVLGAAVTVSDDGRYLAFMTEEPLVGADVNGSPDAYIHDSCRGATGCTPSVVLASPAMDGSAAGGVYLPRLSASGRYVAYQSNATNIVPETVSGAGDIYMHDTCLGAAGCTPSSTLASVPPDGTTPSWAFTQNASVSSDGRYVAFAGYSLADNKEHVYVRDTCVGATGCTPATLRITEAGDGTAQTGQANSPLIGDDGRHVVFISSSDNLDGPATPSLRHVYRADTCLGVAGACTRSIVRIDVTADASESDGFVRRGGVAIDGTGRFIAWVTNATNVLAVATNDTYQLYVRDTCAGAAGCTPTTTLESRSGSAGGDGEVGSPSLSPDGRFVVFSTEATDLIAGDSNGYRDVLVRDRVTGETRRVSTSLEGVQGDDHACPAAEIAPDLSADGAIVGFSSSATNLIADDSNAVEDAFVASTGF